MIYRRRATVHASFESSGDSNESSWTFTHAGRQEVLLGQKLLFALASPVGSSRMRPGRHRKPLPFAQQAIGRWAESKGGTAAQHLRPNDFVVAEICSKRAGVVSVSKMTAFRTWVAISITALLVTLRLVNNQLAQTLYKGDLPLGDCQNSFCRQYRALQTPCSLEELWYRRALGGGSHGGVHRKASPSTFQLQTIRRAHQSFDRS